jgi:hypothetical protein
LERPHKLPMTKIKRKKKLQEVNGVEPKDEITPEDMDLYVNIEDIEFPNEKRRVHESRKVVDMFYLKKNP